MNIRKFALIWTLVTSCVCLSCSSTDDTGDDLTVTFKVTADNITFSKTGGQQTFSVQSMDAVSAESDQPWCKVTVGETSPKLKATPVKVEVGENTEVNDRQATISIKSGSNVHTVSVTQLPKDGILLEETTMNVGNEGETVTVKLKSNADYKVEISDTWLKVVTTRANMQEHETVLEISKNNGNERSASVTFTVGEATETLTVIQAAGQTSDITADAKSIASQMYPGWNLGNTLEGNNNGTLFSNNVGLGGETSWQGTKTTQAIIDFVKSQGFRSVRIPCNWVCGHISDATDNTIDKAWMARVREIVDYCINAGLYVVLNDHWDGGWIEDGFTEATADKNVQIMKDIWTQIANEFINYDEHLLFAGLNEPSASTQAQTDVLLKYEQAFIDAVRATGGNNAKRILVVQGPCTDIERTEQFYKTMPTDIEEGRLMMEVHYYTPPQFTGVWENGNPYYFWGSENHASDDTFKKYNSTWGEETSML
ncbi:MAG: cellulase family glycosylhydrolase, partial [Prevotella sp.]